MPVSIISAIDLKLAMASNHPPTVIDARGAELHGRGHIPFSSPMNWEDWSARPPEGANLDLLEPGYWGELASPGLLDYEALFSSSGISNDIPVVVYADGKLSKGREGRIAWMLLYLGVNNVSLLDGGWSAWVSSGGEVSTTDYRLGRGNFQVRLQHERRVTLDALRRKYSQGPMPCSVDTRLQSEYDGLSYDYQPRSGHLPGANQLTYESLFEDDGTFVSKYKFFSLLAPEVLRNQRFTYCEVGVRASTYALLYEVYTGKVLPVYDASIMQWGLCKDLPVLDGEC